MKIDVTKLEDYIVVPLPGTEVAQAKDLRELDQDFGHGVAALWSDAAQGILAFVFDPMLWDEAAARVWVQQARDGGALPEGRAGAGEGEPPMPYASMTQVPPDIRGIQPPVTLSHANMIAAWAAALTQAPDGPDNPWPAALANFKQAYVVQDGQWVPQTAGHVMLSFASSLADGTCADVADGYVWKEIIRPGAWFKMNTGRQVEVTADIIREAVRAFHNGLPKFISVPADSHHLETRGVVPAEANRGFVERLKLVGTALFGGFRFTDQQVAAGVQDGSIADCSVYLQPDVFHPATGEKFPWVLRHVLLTNDPLAQELGRFGDIPASSDDDTVTIIHYRPLPVKEVSMLDNNGGGALESAEEIVLTGDAAHEYAILAGLGLTASELKALAEQRQAIAAQAAELRQKTRALEVVQIVRALEGVGVHDGVAQVPGYRHYPVVIAAVEKVLQEAPPTLALDAHDRGASPLDTAVLAILNALPAEARIKNGEVPLMGEKQRAKSLSADGASVTDAQIDKLLLTIG